MKKRKNTLSGNISYIFFLFVSMKINEKLKGYKISGSICSGGASRDFHQQKNQKSTSLLKRTNFSPCQRLSDYGKHFKRYK